MKTNSSIPLGGIVLIKKVEKRFGAFKELFSGIGGKSKDFLPCIKLHVYNKLTHSVSTHQIVETYPEEIAEHTGVNEMPAERSLYRALERVGKYFPIIMDRYQQLIKKHGLVDSDQVIDFSSTYLEGSKAELAEFGYSRDKRPDKLQINFGIATGINGIPTALTIQKGNVQDKKHIREMLKIISKVIPQNSLLIFDTGANSKENKNKITEQSYNYLTLKPKKVGTYKNHIQFFMESLKKGNAEHFEMNERHYSCVKRKDKNEMLYVFFSPELCETQIKIKEQKFERQKKKGNTLLKKRKLKKIPSDAGWVELIPHLQKTLSAIDNPYITGVEGFFILESSLDEKPEKILMLYKERDKAEKFIRALKEGIELRPVRHWSKWAIIGIFFISFLTNFLINLTYFLSDKPISPIVKNVKLLKKFLINLTLTTVYPQDRFKFSVLSNVSPQILSIFGDIVWIFEDKSLNLRW
jgi:transposase